MHRPSRRKPETKPAPHDPPGYTTARPHVCPPSDAKHPKDRWETLFVYTFLCKFTQLRTRVEGFESPMEYVAHLLLVVLNSLMVSKMVQSRGGIAFA